MAQPIPCDICQATTADFLISNTQDGSVTGVGVECLLDWAVPIVEAYAAAVAREAGTTPGADEAATAPPDDWEQGYPEGAPKTDERSATPAEDDDQETAEPSEAAHVAE